MTKAWAETSTTICLKNLNHNLHIASITKHLPFQTDDLNHELKDFPNGNDLEKGEPADEEDEPGCIKVKI